MTKSLIQNPKTLALAGGAVVVAAGVFFLTKDARINKEDVAGTIVASERFGGEELTEEDVVLGDETISDFVQTEHYDRLLTDESFRALASDPGFAALAQHPQAIAAIAAAPEAIAALASAPQALAALASAPQAMAVWCGPSA